MIKYQGLIESDYFYLDEDYTEEYYLYDSGSDVFPFCVFSHELECLNDYCYFLYKSLDNKIDKVEEEKKDIINGEKIHYNEEYGDLSKDVLFSIEEFILPEWKNHLHFSLKSTCIVLQLSFLEWVLKSICEYLKSVSTPHSSFKYNIGKDKIRNYIEHINLYTDDKVFISSELFEGLDSARKYRNKFAHGDWEDISFGRGVEVNLKDIFQIISKIIVLIEKELIKSKII